MRGFYMKNCSILIVCLLVSGILLCGCNIKSNNSPIKYTRRLEKYLQPEGTPKKTQGRTVDLSEGPQVRYEKNVGPKDLNFDIKVVTPY